MKLNKIIFLMLSISYVHQLQAQLQQEFSFGNNKTISSTIPYSEELGYGFDFNSASRVQFTEKGFTTNSSVYFSIKLPEGNYKIDVVLGGEEASKTTIKAESRRLMLAEKKIDKGKTTRISFNVHLHYQSIINSSKKVNLKSREFDDLDWDEKLTLEFLGNPAIQKFTITSANTLTTIFLAGDSTVTNQDLEPWASWGQFLSNYINQKAVVANYAASGASLQSFKARKRLEKILSRMKKGDYLIIEFGHNDEKITGEGNGAYGLYSYLLKEFIDATRERGGIPILVTPTQRRAFENGKLKPTHGDFPNAMRNVAARKEVPLIDITNISTIMYESWGDEASRNAFVQYPANTFPGQDEKLEDNTHFNNFGANEIALAFIQGVKDEKLSLMKFLKKKIPNYNTRKPNQISEWTLPMSPRFEGMKPYGN